MQRKIFTKVQFTIDDFKYHLTFWLVLYFLHWHNFFYSNIKMEDSINYLWGIFIIAGNDMAAKFQDALLTAKLTIIACFLSSYLHSYFVLPATIGNVKLPMFRAYLFYVLATIFLAGFSCFLFQSVYETGIIGRGVKEINHNWERNLPESFFNMYLLTGLIYIRKWFHNSEDLRMRNELLEKENLLLEKDVKIQDYKVKALNQQIKPHFLFNSLNHIYVKSLRNPTAVPAIVEKFSDVLEYIVYDCSNEKVSLLKELDFIKKFIDIEIQGLDETTFKKEIIIEDSNIDKDIKIAPLLLLPLIENGVKYGIKKTDNNKSLKLKISIKENNVLVFKMKNSQSTEPQGEQIGNRGVGIRNLRERLKMFYPEKHELELNSKNDVFETILKIQL